MSIELLNGYKFVHILNPPDSLIKVKHIFGLFLNAIYLFLN